MLGLCSFWVVTWGLLMGWCHVGWQFKPYILWFPDWLLYTIETIAPFVPFIFKYIFFPVCGILLIQLLWRLFNFYKKDNNSSLPIPPGSFGLLVAGETPLFWLLGASFIERRFQQHGKMFTTHLFGAPTIRVIGGELVSKMMQYEPRLMEIRWPTSARHLLGSGCLANTKGKLHRQHKQTLLKAFTPKVLDLYVGRSQPIVVDALLKWCEECNIKTYKKCRELTFHLACEVLLGFQMTPKERATMLADFQIFVDNIFCFPYNLPFFGFRKGMKARKRLLKQIDVMLKRGITPDNLDTGLVTRFIAEIAEKSDGEFGREEVCNSALELLFAGHETLSSAACTLIEHIGQRPDIVEKLRSELDNYNLLVSETDCDISMQSLRRLHYLDNVIREVLRVQPPVGAGMRLVNETFELGGYQVPKGWTLVYSIRQTQELWSEENKFTSFNPDRWDELDANALKQCPHNYFPFGLGVHSCLGREYARIILKLLAVEIVRLCDVYVEKKKRKYRYLPSPYPTDFLPSTFTRRFQEAPVKSMCASA